MSDIAERLKSVAKAGGTGWEDEQDETVRRFISDAAWAAKDAADEIEQLHEELQEAKAELKRLNTPQEVPSQPKTYENIEEALRALDGEGE